MPQNFFQTKQHPLRLIQPLRYVSYDEISDAASGDIIIESSDIMAAVMIERLAMIILKLKFKSSTDWCQMKTNLDFFKYLPIRAK